MSSSLRYQDSATPSMLEPHWDFSWLFFVILCHGDPALYQKDRVFIYPNSSQMMRILVWANSEPRICVSGMSDIVNLPVLPYPHHQGKFSTTALARPPNADICSRQGQFSHSHALEACSPGSMQNQIHCVAQSRNEGHFTSAAVGEGLG